MSSNNKAWTKALRDGSKVALYVQGAGTKELERLNGALDQLQRLGTPDVVVIAPPGIEYLVVDAMTIEEVRGG